MSPNRKRPLQALAGLGAGCLFAVGLILGGMTQPGKVIGFLDLFGAWDASLAFVMGGALGVNYLLRRWTLRSRTRPAFAPAFNEPPESAIDGKLLVGAALFGVGWGLGGFCPGPAVVSLGAASSEALVFTAAMLAGMYAFEIYQRRPTR